jgi:hypothetical protein
MIDVIVTTMDGDKIAAKVDPDFLGMLIHMAERKHFPVERKWLAKEDRYVWVGDASKPPKQMLSKVALADPSEATMGIEEFNARQAGTYTDAETGMKSALRQLIGKALGQEAEEEPKPTLN